MSLDAIKLSDEALEFNDAPAQVWMRVRDAEKLIYSRNPKRHDFGALITSLARYGYQEAAKYDSTLRAIKAGNGRIEALAKMERDGQYALPRGLAKHRESGEWCLPILMGTDAPSETEALAYLVDANNITMLGGDLGMHEMARMWDQDIYAAILADLQELDSAPVSMESDDISALLAGMETQSVGEAESADADKLVDRAEELQKKWKVASGDVWQIGRHFIICGDCTNFDDWVKLLKLAGVEKVNGVFTSPPYAEQRKKQYGGIPTEKYVEWWYDVQANVRAFLADDGSFFVNIKPHCEDGERVLYVFDLVLAMRRNWKWMFRDEFIWKHSGFPGEYKYRHRNQFEPIYHFTIAHDIKHNPLAVGHESNFIRDNSNGRMAPTNADNDRDAGKSLPFKHGIAQVGNVVECSPNSESTGHKAVFPLTLVEFFIKAYSDENDIWLDPFVGSGTTIVAAHKNNRRGIGIERLEKYVSVCLERLQKLDLQPCLLK